MIDLCQSAGFSLIPRGNLLFENLIRNVHSHVYKKPPLVHVLIQVSPIQISQIISSPSGFPTKFLLHLQFFAQVLLSSSPSHSLEEPDVR